MMTKTLALLLAAACAVATTGTAEAGAPSGATASVCTSTSGILVSGAQSSSIVLRTSNDPLLPASGQMVVSFDCRRPARVAGHFDGGASGRTPRAAAMSSYLIPYSFYNDAAMTVENSAANPFVATCQGAASQPCTATATLYWRVPAPAAYRTGTYSDSVSLIVDSVQ